MQLFLAFIAGLAAGLSCSVFFVIGMKVRRNIETTGRITGKTSIFSPVLRTDSEEAELEEMIHAREGRINQ